MARTAPLAAFAFVERARIDFSRGPYNGRGIPLFRKCGTYDSALESHDRLSQLGYLSHDRTNLYKPSVKVLKCSHSEHLASGITHSHDYSDPLRCTIANYF